MCVAVPGPDHPDTIHSQAGLGVGLHMLGRYSEAEDHLRQARDSSVRVLGPDHPETLHRMSELASVLRARRQNTEAGRLFASLLNASRRILGDRHPLTNDAATGLESTLFDAEFAHKATGLDELASTLVAYRTESSGLTHGDTSRLLKKIRSLVADLRTKSAHRGAAARTAILRRCPGIDRQTLEPIAEISTSKPLNEQATQLVRRRLGPGPPPSWSERFASRPHRRTRRGACALSLVSARVRSTPPIRLRGVSPALCRCCRSCGFHDEFVDCREDREAVLRVAGGPFGTARYSRA